MTIIKFEYLTVHTNRTEWVVRFRRNNEEGTCITCCGEFLLETLSRSGFFSEDTSSASYGCSYLLQQEYMLRMMLRIGSLHIHEKNGKLIARIRDNEPLPEADSLEELFLDIILPHAALNAYKEVPALGDLSTHHATYIALYQRGSTYTAIPFSTLSPRAQGYVATRDTCPVEALRGAVLSARYCLDALPESLELDRSICLQTQDKRVALKKLLKTTGLLCIQTRGSNLWRVVSLTHRDIPCSACEDLFGAIEYSAINYSHADKEPSSKTADKVPVASSASPVEMVLHLDKFYSTAALCLPVSDMASIILSHEGTPVSVEAVASDRLQDAATASHKDSKLHVFCDVLFLDDPEGASFYIRVFVCHRGSCTLLKKLPVPYDVAEAHFASNHNRTTDTTQRILLDYLRKNLTEILKTTKKSK